MKKIGILLPVLIFLIGLLYRTYGLNAGHPFWVDEFSSADQAKLILQRGFSLFNDRSIFVESHNITTHFLIAISFTLFGISEFSARLPVAIIGSLVPVAVYFAAKKMFDEKTALAAMLLTACSYFEIVWSRQARSYVIVQFLILASMYYYFSIIGKKRSWNYYICLFVTLFLGLLTHFLFYIFAVSLALHAAVYYRSEIQWKKIMPIILPMLIIIFYISSGFLYKYFINSFTLTNNIWYYHSFLWREYGLLTFLAGIGFAAAYLEQNKKISLLLIHTALHLLFICFFFPPYVSRYLLPVFPYIIISAGYSIAMLADLIHKRIKTGKLKFLPINPLIISMIIAGAIVANGHKFVNKPEQFFSVNHDFREIALIDYNNVYNLIKEKGNLDEGKTAVIETWDARLYWYLGKYPGRYVFRWENEPGTVNGLVKRTEYIYNKSGEKVIPNDTGEGFIGTLADLKKVLKKYPKGFIFIDDASLPGDVRDYAEKNFRKELYLDHYYLDDNPYSIWPSTLYSWGINS